MKRSLIKSALVFNNNDIRVREAWKISVFDGTGTMLPKNDAVIELMYNNELFYCPFVGNISRIKFPDLENGEVADSNTIEQIRQEVQ